MILAAGAGSCFVAVAGAGAGVGAYTYIHGDLAKLSIRVGMFGDKTKSNLIYDKIIQKL